MKRLTIITLFLVSIITYSQTSNKTAKLKFSNNWKTYETEDYSIQYPDDFVFSDATYGVEFNLYSPKTSPNDTFRENFNLTIGDYTGRNMTFDKLIKVRIQECKQLPNVQMLSYQKVSINGNKAYRIVLIVHGRGGKLKLLQYHLLKNDISYVLTWASEIKQYRRYMPIGKKIMKTFTFK